MLFSNYFRGWGSVAQIILLMADVMWYWCWILTSIIKIKPMMVNFSITWPSSNITSTHVTADQYTYLLVSNPLFVCVCTCTPADTCMYVPGHCVCVRAGEQELPHSLPCLNMWFRFGQVSNSEYKNTKPPWNLVWKY